MWFKHAGFETLQDAKDFWNNNAKPALDKRLNDLKAFFKAWTADMKSYVSRTLETYVTGTIERFRDNDAKKIVENVREAIDPMVAAAGSTILKQWQEGASKIGDQLLAGAEQRIAATVDRSVQVTLKRTEESASKIGDQLLAGAQKRVDLIVDHSIRTTLEDAKTLLANESPLIAGIERVFMKADKILGDLNQTIERGQKLLPHLRELAGLNDPLSAKQTMDGIRETTQNLKIFVGGANSLIPQLNVVLKEWHAERERERQFNWRVVLGNTAFGLLVVTFVYAVYLKIGWKVTPVRAISLFWLGISIPIMLLNVRSLWVVWRAARDARLESEVHRRIFEGRNIVSALVLVLLIAANLILNFWL